MPDRTTFRLGEELMARVDAYAARRYPGKEAEGIRSAAMRELIDAGLEARGEAGPLDTFEQELDAYLQGAIGTGRVTGKKVRLALVGLLRDGLGARKAPGTRKTGT